jgi:hypothetical protein
MKKIEATMQEIWAATRPIVQKNRKKYSRKNKNKDDWKKAIDGDRERDSGHGDGKG